MSKGKKLNGRGHHSDGFKLPNIAINNRVTNGELRKNRSLTQRLPTPKQNGGHMSNPRLTNYRQGRSSLKADNYSEEENHKSRPVRQGGDQRYRQVYSAPNKKGRTAPLPKLNNLVNQELESSSPKAQPQHTGYAGITTRERDLGTGKFATSWANTRSKENFIRHEEPLAKHEKKNRQAEYVQPSPVTESKKPPQQKNQFQFHAAKSNEKENKAPIVLEERKLQDSKPSTQGGNESTDKNDKVQRKTETKIHLLTRLSLEQEKNRQTTRTSKQKWDNSPKTNEVKVVETKAKQREELTFKPNINQSDHVFTVYTGLTKQDIRNNKLNLDQSIASEKGDNSGVTPSVTASAPVLSVSTGHKNEYILTRREAQAYINMHTAYNNTDTKKQRKAKLIDRLSEAQLAYIKQHNERLKLKEKQKQESKLRQQKQLTYLRRKFEKDQWRRFRSQYVTNRVVEHELMNRHEYGLPQELDDDVQYGAKLKRKKQKPIENVNKDVLRKRNAKKYEKMFNAYNNSSVNKREKVPKMEGIDTIVVLEKDKNGQMVEKKKMVSDVIKEAEKEIESSNQQKDDENIPKTHQPDSKKRAPSPKSSHDKDALNISLDSLDLDDDDDDIFERARKKYNLDIQSSLDTNSTDHR